MVSIFQECLDKCQDAHMHMYNYEYDFLQHCGVLYGWYKAGKGNPKQRKLAKELLEEAGLI